MLSLVSWLFAQLPQIYKNYTLQSTAGLSIFFLIEWCLGDISNLLGAIYTRQATWQVELAAYYCLVDCMLVAQWVWYEYFRQWKARNSFHDKDDDAEGGVMQEVVARISPISRTVSLGSSQSSIGNQEASKSTRNNEVRRASCSMSAGQRHHVNLHGRKNESMPRIATSLAPITLPKMALFLTLLTSVSVRGSPLQPSIHFQSQTLGHVESPTEVAGRIFSWLSTALYLLSRLPQLMKNFNRGSTSGLSPALFVAAFFGNLFYSMSVATNPCAWSDFGPYGGGGWVDVRGSNVNEWLGRAAPFFIGAAGVLFLDGLVFCQFLAYGEGNPGVVIIKEPKSGRRRWRAVNGWMRGWIPSPGEAKVVVEGERERLVDPDREGSRVYGGL